MAALTPLQRLVRLAVGPDEAIDLAEAALLVASDEYPELDPSRYLGMLDELAADVRAHLAVTVGAGGMAEIIHAINAILFEGAGFRGNEDNYYDPRNSYLNEVLDRRLGIPITLAIVFLAVAGRVGLAAEGVGLPGHYIVRCGTPGGPARAGGEVFYLDVFNRGAQLSEEDCAELVQTSTGAEVAWNPQWLEPWPKKATLARLLRNLKQAYLRRDDLVRALAAAERALLFEPSAADLRDRGILLARLGQHMAGWHDLTTYLQAVPNAPDAAQMRQLAEGIWRLLGRTN